MNPNRNKGLDTLRAAAIVMVILRHAAEILRRPLPDWFNHGWAGVDLFFVLSGYLIGSRLFREARERGDVDARHFYLNRLFRILPAYLVTIALYKAWPAFSGGERMEPLWRFLLFVTNIGWTGGAFSHAWSLNIEEHYYLALPLLVALHARWPRLVRPAWIFGLVFAGGAALRYHAYSIGAPWSAAIYRPTYTHLDGLAVGTALALIEVARPKVWERLTTRPRLMAWIGVLLVGFGMALYKGPKGEGAALLTFPLVGFGFGALLLVALSPGSWLARARIPGAAALAAAAYSLYLTHKGMFMVALELAGGRDAFAVAAVLAVALAALGGAAMYFAIERPFLRLRDRLLRSK